MTAMTIIAMIDYIRDVKILKAEYLQLATALSGEQLTNLIKVKYFSVCFRLHGTKLASYSISYI